MQHRISVCIVSACRGLMELGGRLIECLPSFFLKCRNLCFLPMDSWAAFSLGGFVAGWLARDWSLRAPEIPICRCECSVGSSPVECLNADENEDIDRFWVHEFGSCSRSATERRTWNRRGWG